MERGDGMNSATPPLNVTQLNGRLAQVANDLGIPVARARVMLCTLIISQMLPDTVTIKGGMGVKLRFGERGTRATSDLDVSTRARGEEFERTFRERLAKDGEPYPLQGVSNSATPMHLTASPLPQRSGPRNFTTQE